MHLMAALSGNIAQSGATPTTLPNADVIGHAFRGYRGEDNRTTESSADIHAREPAHETASQPERKRQKLPGRIARDLAAAILSGEYKPGDRLFGEIAFSDRLNVSRATYREAIQILATKGMVSSNPRGGTIVNDKSMWQFLDPEVLDLLFETGPEKELLQDLRELLAVLMPKAAALASLRRSDAMLARMQTAFDAMHAGDGNQHACQDFHCTVFQASGNTYVTSLARGLAAAIDAALRFQRQNGANWQDHVRDHWRILQAITFRSGEEADRYTQNLIDRAFLAGAMRSA
jgi:DNA-binding FadR family transcriptional regulator